jgi:toxin ParE1/3/4
VARLNWTRQARADLRAIRRFIAKDSPRYAAQVTSRITHATRRLEQFPLSGRLVPEDHTGRRREIVAPPYRVVYWVHEDVVEILTVLHGARRLTELPDA